jgi:hypothetical protein
VIPPHIRQPEILPPLVLPVHGFPGYFHIAVPLRFFSGHATFVKNRQPYFCFNLFIAILYLPGFVWFFTVKAY